MSIKTRMKTKVKMRMKTETIYMQSIAIITMTMK